MRTNRSLIITVIVCAGCTASFCFSARAAPPSSSITGTTVVSASSANIQIPSEAIREANTLSNDAKANPQLNSLPELTLTSASSTITVDAATVTSWEENGSVEVNNIFNDNSLTLTDVLNNFFIRSNIDSQTTYYYEFAPDKIYSYVAGLAQNIDVPAADPVLTIVNNRATNFTPPQTGQILDAYTSTFNILEALEAGHNTAALAINQSLPAQALADTNNLGINQLLAEGVSGFKGSPNNRRHNIAAGIEKFKGLIIPPGQEFSFDDNLGPVTADAGFLPELVIDNGTTKPELGGGLCQVSTTTFRAAMAAGLPITDRRNHAYAVSYYSPQGTDATIYPGSADLKFINNTPGSILIWPYEKDPNTLVFDFYSTKDGRQVTLKKPVVYDRTPDGAMKATWTRLITNNGTTTTDVFKSNYQPPALFHETETFVTANSTRQDYTREPIELNKIFKLTN